MLDPHRITFALLGTAISVALGSLAGLFVVARTLPFRHVLIEFFDAWNSLADAFISDPHREKRFFRQYYERGFFMRMWSIPKFAIGMELITAQEAVSIENGILAQSDLAFGIIFPLSLLIWSLVTRIGLGIFGYCGVLIGSTVATTGLFVTGMERRLKYTKEIQSLVLGRWSKKLLDLPRNRGEEDSIPRG
jgi:hypothetical protein